MTAFLLTLLLLFPDRCERCPRDAHGRIKRSTTARRAFQRAHPCPSTNSGTGPCPGWRVDHIKPLACGGPDVPENMQWESVKEAKAKDRTERRGCSF